MTTLDPVTRLSDALQPTRSLMFYTLTAMLPIIVIAGALLFTNASRTVLLALASIGSITSFIGFGRLLYEMTLDLAGFPDFKLPIWSVFYLIVYVISAFTFLFYALHQSAPGRYIEGFSTGPQSAYLDALYLSLTNYIGVSPDPSIVLSSHTGKFVSVGQGVLSLFINLVIITKFVNSF